MDLEFAILSAFIFACGAMMILLKKVDRFNVTLEVAVLSTFIFTIRAMKYFSFSSLSLSELRHLVARDAALLEVSAALDSKPVVGEGDVTAGTLSGGHLSSVLFSVII